MLSKLEAEIKTSLLSGQRARAETLKMLKSAVLLEQKENPDYADTNFLATVRKQIKMRTDAIEMYKKAGSTEQAAKEEQEVIILNDFLPAQITQDELTFKIEELAKSNNIAFERQNMGQLIGLVSKEVGDSASKSDIAKVINSKIS